MVSLNSGVSPTKPIIAKIVKITRGDLHEGLMDELGRVYHVGKFKSRAGYVTCNKTSPTLINIPTVKRLASGRNHLTALCENGSVYVIGIIESKKVNENPRLSVVQLSTPDPVTDIISDGVTTVLVTAKGVRNTHRVREFNHHEYARIRARTLKPLRAAK